MTALLVILLLIYASVIVYYYLAWEKQPLVEGHFANNTPFFSIIVAARNEERTLSFLLPSLLRQEYPAQQFEILVVDDSSKDDTVTVAKKFAGVQVVSIKEKGINSYKKKAIETGIAHARGEWIVCTDADCIAQPGWLSSIAACIENTQALFIAAPVSMVAKIDDGSNPSFLSMFQQLDFMVLQGITAVAVFKKMHAMCNGANVAYRKDVFYEVGGFAGIDSIASGDDMLLMQKILDKYPQGAAYVKSKNAIITTETMPTWRAFLNQRIRWASKASHYNDGWLKAVLVLVYLFNLSFLVTILLTVYNFYFVYMAVGMWIVKTVIEWPFIKSLCAFYGKKVTLFSFFLFQPVHILYTVLAGFMGQMGQYEWKGRRVK